MPGGRSTSLLDPIPASHCPLAGSEAAVPGEKRGPGKAQSLGGPAYKDSHKPPLFETPGFVGKGRGFAVRFKGEGPYSLYSTIDFYNSY